MSMDSRLTTWRDGLEEYNRFAVVVMKGVSNNSPTVTGLLVDKLGMHTVLENRDERLAESIKSWVGAYLVHGLSGQKQGGWALTQDTIVVLHIY